MRPGELLDFWLHSPGSWGCSSFGALTESQTTRLSTPASLEALLCQALGCRRWRELEQLGLYLPVGFHAEGLQLLILRQHAVQPLHQRDSLVNAHLNTAEDGRHLVDLLDLLRILGVLLLSLLHEAVKSFH